MGFHATYKGIIFRLKVKQATRANLEMFDHIKTRAMDTTRELAVERGACPDDDSCTVRNAHLLAIAPNASSSIICGNTSPSIEPFRANAYTQKTKSESNLEQEQVSCKVLEKLVDRVL